MQDTPKKCQKSFGQPKQRPLSQKSGKKEKAMVVNNEETH